PVPQIALTLTLDGLDAEQVEETCFEFGAVAVSYTDQRDDAILEPAPGEFRLWPHSRLQALFPFDCKPEEIVAGLVHVLRVEPGRISVETLADRVWEREWLRDFHPMCFGQRLWVAPHHSHVHTQGAVIVRLDPGLAFGTGTHATTAMCLAWLDENTRAGQVVIDYGCGSGVLAVAAAGWARVRRTPSTSIPRPSPRHATTPPQTRSIGRCTSSPRMRSCPAGRTSCWLTSCARRFASWRRDSP